MNRTEWEHLVSRITYKPGWSLKIGGPDGRFLCVLATTTDSLDHSRTRTTQFMHALPPEGARIDVVRWIFDVLVLCERHEVGEFYTVDGTRPFEPGHNGEPSYTVIDRRAPDELRFEP